MISSHMINDVVTKLLFSVKKVDFIVNTEGGHLPVVTQCMTGSV